MALTTKLRNHLIAAVPAGNALIIALALLVGVDGQINSLYQNVGRVWAVCSGITGPDVVQSCYYSDDVCDALLVKHLTPVKTAVDGALTFPIYDYTPAGGSVLWSELLLTDLQNCNVQIKSLGTLQRM